MATAIATTSASIGIPTSLGFPILDNAMYEKLFCAAVIVHIELKKPNNRIIERSKIDQACNINLMFPRPKRKINVSSFLILNFVNWCVQIFSPDSCSTLWNTFIGKGYDPNDVWRYNDWLLRNNKQLTLTNIIPRFDFEIWGFNNTVKLVECVDQLNGFDMQISFPIYTNWLSNNEGKPWCSCTDFQTIFTMKMNIGTKDDSTRTRALLDTICNKQYWTGEQIKDLAQIFTITILPTAAVFELLKQPIPDSIQLLNGNGPYHKNNIIEFIYFDLLGLKKSFTEYDYNAVNDCFKEAIQLAINIESFTSTKYFYGIVSKLRERVHFKCSDAIKFGNEIMSFYRNQKTSAINLGEAISLTKAIIELQ